LRPTCSNAEERRYAEDGWERVNGRESGIWEMEGAAEGLEM
jgi:hypothetical protein